MINCLWDHVQEDGVAEGVAAFHRHLPLEDLILGKPTVWQLAQPGVTDLFSETGTGIVGFFTHPYKAAKRDGEVLRLGCSCHKRAFSQCIESIQHGTDRMQCGELAFVQLNPMSYSA